MSSLSAAHPVGSSIMLLGGFGFLSRLHGLSIDNLVEVEMVLSDGRIIIVNKDEHPGNLSLNSDSIFADT
jgi:FAD/FMN-containing dehydrogenase